MSDVNSPARNGLFIVFDGLDGSGKTTQLRLLKERLESEGHKVVITAEPTDSAVGRQLREALRGDIAPTAAQLSTLFLLDRIGHNVAPVNGIRALLDEGYTVLCDRYYYSSMAYQGFDTSFDWVAESNLNCPDILRPDGCIIFDLPAEVCMRRIEDGRDQKEIYETVSKQDELRRRFAYIASYIKERGGETIITVNADGTVEDVARLIYEAYLKIKNK